MAHSFQEAVLGDAPVHFSHVCSCTSTHSSRCIIYVCNTEYLYHIPNANMVLCGDNFDARSRPSSTIIIKKKQLPLHDYK